MRDPAYLWAMPGAKALKEDPVRQHPACLLRSDERGVRASRFAAWPLTEVN